MLIPFTADKFRTTEEEGRSVVAKLESPLENKHVVFFVKYFDKLFPGEVTRKLPLTKICLYEDVFDGKDAVLAEPIMEDVAPSQTESKEAIVLTKEDDDVQFFSPSMKQRIDQISASIDITAANLGTPSRCKRVWAFGEVKKATATFKIELVDDDVPLRSNMKASGSGENHVKKMKATAGQN